MVVFLPLGDVMLSLLQLNLLNVKYLASLIIVYGGSLLLLRLDSRIVLLLSQGLSILRHFINYYLFQ
jgi:hypothetical protein